MNFEFDPRKSEANKLKHGIDFEEAQRLWDDDNRVVLASRYPGEPRFLTIGLINGKPWTAIWTARGESLRIISVRRARKEEVELCHGGRA